MTEDKGTMEHRSIKASNGSMTTLPAITEAINETVREYTQAGKVKCAGGISSGLCEEFANDVQERLGRPTDVSAIDYAKLTGPPGADLGDEIFYGDALLK